MHLVRVPTSGHVTKMANTPFDPSYAKNPCYMQTSWLYVLQNQSFCQAKIARIWIFELNVSATLTFTRWPSYTNLARILWRYRECANINFLRQGFRKLSSNSNRHADRHDRNYIPRYFARGRKVVII